MIYSRMLFYKCNAEKVEKVANELNIKSNFKVIEAAVSNEDDFVKLPTDKIKEAFETLLFGKMIARKCTYPLVGVTPLNDADAKKISKNTPLERLDKL